MISSKTEKKFQINFFEFMFLVEACIPPRPIARSFFWDDVINKYYHLMTQDERKHLYKSISDNLCFIDGLDKENEQCLIFKARFNPLNQYGVKAHHPNGNEEWVHTFLYKGKYHTEINYWVTDEHIKDITPIYEN